MTLPKSMRFLIAEDDPAWVHIAKALVSAAECQCDTVDNWPRFVNFVRRRVFDRIIVDLSLNSSSETGVETLQFVNQFAPPDTMVLTTYCSTRVMEACYTLPFVKLVVPKARIREHVCEIEEFFRGRIERSFLESLLRVEAGGARSAADGRAEDNRVVFVVHGRNAAVRKEMFSFLRSLGLLPLEWGEAVSLSREGAPYIGVVLDRALQHAAAVLVLLTGDDEARLLEKHRTADEPPYETELTRQARPNVIFEAGLAFGRKPESTILVQMGNIRPFSDVVGRHTLRFRGTVEDRHELANRLQAAGCLVRRDGTDWLSKGNFDKVDV